MQFSDAYDPDPSPSDAPLPWPVRHLFALWLAVGMLSVLASIVVLVLFVITQAPSW